MNKKNLKRLYQMDFKTLADIATREVINRKGNNLNIYYDVGTNEAKVYPEDDKEGIPLRPLKQRLLRNGVRLNFELASYVADSLEKTINEVKNA